MDIENAIYTHTKVRRDTHSTGFGYYSVSKGMDRLLQDSKKLSSVTSGYISPRNSEIWWEKDEQDKAKRDELEAMRIREHHPISFGCTGDIIDGREYTLLSFGRNLGRDLSPMTRDGNILVNTLAVPTDELNGYPFEYYGSRELFTDHERWFFENAGDEPAEELETLDSITKGELAPTEADVESFLEEEGRVECLLSMLRALREIADGGSIRRMIVCDKKENMILWVAALSLVYPKEAAKSFSFKTYSFIGCNADDFTPSYDDVYFIGAYTPTVNGDPEYPRATNYDLKKECANGSTAVFDLEQGYIEELDDSYPYFDMFIESAYSTDMRILKSYHDFIISRTTCLSLGSDYAKGYGCYTILQLKNENSLRYISDAYDFALKYMDSSTVAGLLSIAYSCTIDAGKESFAFSDILNVSSDCIKKGLADKELIKAHYISFLIRIMTMEGSKREDYFRLKEQIGAVFLSANESYEQELVSAFTLDGIMQMTLVDQDSWKLYELSRFIGSVIISGSRVCGTEDELMDVYVSLCRQLIISDYDNAADIIKEHADMLKRTALKAGFLEKLYTSAGDIPDMLICILICAARLCLEDSGAVNEMYSFAIRHDECGTLCGLIKDMIPNERSISERAQAYMTITENSGQGQDSCFELFSDDLECRTMSDDVGYEDIYMLFGFAEHFGRAKELDTDSLCKRFYRSAADVFGKYSLDESSGEKLLKIVKYLKAPDIMLKGTLGNMVTLLYAKRYGEGYDESAVFLENAAPARIDFSLMKKPERNECVKTLGEAFASRSRMLGSALTVRYEMFINTENDNDEDMLDEVFMEWVSSLLQVHDKNTARLAGQTLAMSAVKCRLDTKVVGRLIREQKLKYDDVKAGAFNHEVMAYLDKNCRERVAVKAYLNKMMSEIDDSTPAKKASSPFKKIRSKLGGTR
ncbi:MAG: hypothetical protein IJ740_16270 [Ruminococcus sp.]|nr:hypothetical protein [Ruminococcus sp.]